MSKLGVSHEPIVTLEDKVYLETYYDHRLSNVQIDEHLQRWKYKNYILFVKHELNNNNWLSSIWE